MAVHMYVRLLRIVEQKVVPRTGHSLSPCGWMAVHMYVWLLQMVELNWPQSLTVWMTGCTYVCVIGADGGAKSGAQN